MLNFLSAVGGAKKRLTYFGINDKKLLPQVWVVDPRGGVPAYGSTGRNPSKATFFEQAGLDGSVANHQGRDYVPTTIEGNFLIKRGYPECVD
jgi:hypothetical protein